MVSFSLWSSPTWTGHRARQSPSSVPCSQYHAVQFAIHDPCCSYCIVISYGMEHSGPNGCQVLFNKHTLAFCLQVLFGPHDFKFLPPSNKSSARPPQCVEEVLHHSLTGGVGMCWCHFCTSGLHILWPSQSESCLCPHLQPLAPLIFLHSSAYTAPVYQCKRTYMIQYVDVVAVVLTHRGVRCWKIKIIIFQ